MNQETVARFVARATAQGMSVYQAQNPVAARLHLVTWLRQVSARTVWGWAPSVVGVDGLVEALEATGIRWLVPDAIAGGASLPPEEAAHTVGLTAADAAIADTGTLVLLHGPDRPAAAHVVPRVHVAVLHAAHLFPTADAWQRAWHERLARGDAVACSLISGPATTRAVEMTRVAGVSGPEVVHVVVVEDAEDA